MTQLFSPLTIRNATFKNRIVVSSMCMYSSTDGFANDWHLVHLGSRAVGGAALIIQEATAVSAEGRISPGDLGIWKDEHVGKLQQIVSFIHDQNALAGIQLAHAGRKASCKVSWEGGAQIPSIAPGGWTSVAPSDIPFAKGTEAPVALDEAGIEKIRCDFRLATKRAARVGYDVIEIHAAHGYLLHEFYSPLSNKRSDRYGGSFDNRVRLLLEVVQTVRLEWGDEKALFVRISSTEWTDGGWTIEDSVKLSQLLKEFGVDLVDASSGGNVQGAIIPTAPGYQVNFAEAIRKGTGIKTGAVGLITSAEQAEEVLSNDNADLIFLARELLRDPYFPLHAAKKLQHDVVWPVQYDRAKLK
ncbi:MAG: NADH:flavin oxidoreductase/NADH oxidase [Chryseolinea sp.]